MLKFICLASLLIACGGDDTNHNTSPDGGNGSGSGSGSGSNTALSCSAVSFCTTWEADETELTPPTGRGGTIPDGLWRTERGTFDVELIDIKGGKFTIADDSFENRSGTLTTTTDKLSFTYDTSCSKDGSQGSTDSWANRPYYVVDDSTLQIGMSDRSDGTVGWYEYKKITPDQICTADAYFKCRVTNCSCAAMSNGFGTVTDGDKFCSTN